MAKSLFEAYRNRLTVAESVYGKLHNGEKMSNQRKLVTAKVLENVNRFLNESYDQSVGTQRSDMGMWKKFCLNLTTVAMPNLIAHDLVLVHPMSSMSGYVTYIEYQYASNKGETKIGDPIANPFGLYTNLDGTKKGKVDADFTSHRVVEPVTAASTTFAPAWGPVFFTEDDRATSANPAVVVTRADGTVEEFVATAVSEDGKTITFPEYTLGEGDVAKVRYVYNNIVVPQNDLPMIKAEMKSIALVAKARRIAVYYSQIAAYQMKTDYGVDLGDQLAEKAVGELSYEIDTEIVNLLVEGAGEAHAELVWDKTLPIGVSKADHYEGFTEILEIGKQIIYDRTQKFAPNYMICASDVLPVIGVCKGWKAAPAGSINGPYFAGTLNNLKVFVTPNIEAGTFVIGCNGNDMMSTAAVYAPYMSIVPTQLLGFADGGMSQGWSTMYDLKLLNKMLLVKGKIKKTVA